MGDRRALKPGLAITVTGIMARRPNTVIASDSAGLRKSEACLRVAASAKAGNPQSVQSTALTKGDRVVACQAPRDDSEEDRDKRTILAYRTKFI